MAFTVDASGKFWKGFAEIDHSISGAATAVLDSTNLQADEAFRIEWMFFSLLVAGPALSLVEIRDEDDTDLFFNAPVETIPLLGNILPGEPLNLATAEKAAAALRNGLAMTLPAKKDLNIFSSLAGPKYFLRGHGRIVSV